MKDKRKFHMENKSNSDSESSEELMNDSDDNEEDFKIIKT
jgi:hypothetical protein